MQKKVEAETKSVVSIIIHIERYHKVPVHRYCPQERYYSGSVS